MDGLYAVLLVGASVIGYVLRGRFVGILAALLLPALSAGVWLASIDRTMEVSASEEGFRQFVVWTTSYLSVWLGISTGILAGKLAAAQQANSADRPSTGPQERTKSPRARERPHGR